MHKLDQAEKKQLKKIIIAVAVPILASMLLLYILFPPGSSTERELDREPFETTRYDTRTTSIVKNEGLILQQLGSTLRTEQLAQDLHFYATQTYKKYQDGYEGVIGFEINEGSVTQVGDVVYFTGQFGTRESSNVKVEVTVLPNNRISTSIEEDDSVLVSSDLPSQSGLNAFMAALPIYEDRFAIEYIESSDIFYISIFDPDPELGIQAIEYVEQRIGRTLASGEYQLVFPNISGQDTRYPGSSN